MFACNSVASLIFSLARIQNRNDGLAEIYQCNLYPVENIPLGTVCYRLECGMTMRQGCFESERGAEGDNITSIQVVKLTIPLQINI